MERSLNIAHLLDLHWKIDSAAFWGYSFPKLGRLDQFWEVKKTFVEGM